MFELPQHFQGWIEYLQDTRNQIADEFIYPVVNIVNNERMSADEKVESIEKIKTRFMELQSKWNPKEYGVNIP